MKKLFTCLLFVSVLSTASAMTYYVDSTATGGAIGLSWQDAFTDLQAALAVAAPGDTILVAQGTYKPGSDPEATFLIEKDLTLLGGYPSGGGSPDPGLYETILSGDLNGDDVDDQAGTEKADNVMTVVIIGLNVTGEVVIDGFTIRNGYADGFGSDIQNFYGGGIFAEGNLIVRKCFFTQNYAKQRGGAIYSLSENITLEHCTLLKNKANTGGAIYIKEGQYLLNSCTLDQNTAILASFWEADGGGAFIENSTGTVNHCHFQGNEAQEWGGGLMIWSPNSTSGVSTDLLQCTFEDNTSEKRGGGAYFLIRGLNSSNSVSGCSFRENEALNRGGGLDIFAASSSSNISFSIEECHFSENRALAFNGGGLGVVFQAQNSQLLMLRDTFSNNMAAFFGGAAEIAGADSGDGTIGIDSCLFINNSSYNDGGLSIGSVVNAGYFQYSISNSRFIGNHAIDFGGGLDIFSEAPAIFTTENCYFAQNTAGYMGAGIAVATNHPELEVRVTNCILENNSSPLGAAIGICPVVPTGGMTQEAAILFENCLVNANSAVDTAAIFIQKTGNVTLLNCTVADNNASGLSLDANSVATIQNNIFANPGKSELEAPAGNLALMSQGGNLVKDNSMTAFLNSLLDKPGTQPMFENGYYPSEASPQVNGGVNEGVTAETDLDNNPRKQGFVDIGAYESSYHVAVREVLAEIPLNLSPNPVVDEVFVEWPEETSSPVVVRIYNIQGQLLLQNNMPIGRGINVTNLPDGLYLLKGSADGKLFTAKFHKN